MVTINLSKLRKVGGDGTSSDISIVGPTSVTAGTANTYTITDYDDFSVYEVSAIGGTVSRTDGVITLNVASGATGIAELTISRNGNDRVFQIAVGASGVSTPTILYPTTGSVNLPNSFVMQGSNFATVPAGISTHESRRFQIARDSGFVDMVVNVVVNTGNKTQYAVSGLPSGVQYFSRIQDTAVNGDVSSFSSVVSFSVSSQSIQKPIITSSGGSVDVGATPVFTGSAFVAVPAGSDSHVSSSWIVRKALDSSVVWQSINDSANKNSVKLPVGVLETSTSYTAEVQYNGGFGSSMFSDKLTFSTAASFYPTPGQGAGTPFGGGYYAGANIVVDGVEYALVVAPKSLGGESPTTLDYKTAGGGVAGATSQYNGVQNTNAMVAAGVAGFPAAKFCTELSIGGYTDWYLPSSLELEILYRYLKPGTASNLTTSATGVNNFSNPIGLQYTTTNPAQTASNIFKAGGAEALLVGPYWGSTSSGATNPNARLRSFGDGGDGAGSTNLSLNVRAVRRVRVS